jgi:hypothetical protein
VNEWHREQYGNPCRECGFDWSISFGDTLSLAESLPERYDYLLIGRDGSERHPDLIWSACEYTCHVVDNFRIWGERLAGAALGSMALIAPYDSDLLAAARAYASVPLVGALWALGRAQSDWRAAVDLADESGVVLHHPSRGEQAVEEVARGNVHDAVHHLWDIERSL